MTPRRTLLSGAAIVVGYLVALAATTALRTDDARPLYDSFTAPPTYRFVDPPPFFAADNVKPHDVVAVIAFGPGGSEPAGIATPDGQFVLNLARGAIAKDNGATSVAVHITPLAPRSLPGVPQPLRANGNAYRVDMTYEPGGDAVTRFAKPGTMLVEIPELGPTLYFASDAASWSAIPARAIPPRQLSLSATFASPGTYLAATALPELAAQPGRSHTTAVVLGIVTTVVALFLFAGAFVFVRRRQRRADQGAR